MAGNTKTKEIAKTESNLPTKLSNFDSVEEVMKWANTAIESGLLPDSITEPEQVVTIVQHGKELGLSPMIALNNLHVIAGRPVISSSMLGALLKRKGVEWVWEEDFVTIEKPDKSGSDKRTKLKFFWNSPITDSVMETEFSVTWAQMEVAGYTTKHNWKKYPKEMMRARCLAYGVRANFPEILMGIYSDLEVNDIAGQEERPVEMNQEGEIIILDNNEENK